MNKLFYLPLFFVLSAFMYGGVGAPQPSPSHTVDFTTGTLPGEVTFTRASSATYYNSSGIITTATSNTPRFDYNPTSLVLNGLLIEESRANIIYDSTNIGGTNWLSGSLSGDTQNAASAPDGTTTATLQTANGSSQPHNYIYTGVTTAGTYSLSVFVKQGTNATVVFGSSDNTANAAQILFNFNTLAFTTSGGTAGNGSVVGTPYYQALPGGWYRLFLVINFSGGTANQTFTVGPWNDLSGNATSGNTLYVWGAQYETGASVTSYIPTSAGSSTRAIDSAIISSPSWFNATTGSMVTTAMIEALNTARSLATVSFNDGTASNDMFTSLTTASKPQAGIIVSGTEKDSGGSLTAIAANAQFKTGFTYTSGANVASTNGALDTAGTFGASTLPSGINNVTAGDNATQAKTLNGWVQKIQYWNPVLSTPQLQSATR